MDQQRIGTEETAPEPSRSETDIGRPKGLPKESETSEPFDFEQQLKKLENVVQDLEGGELPLEQALVLYEQGVALTRELQAALEGAEHRIKVLAGSGPSTD